VVVVAAYGAECFMVTVATMVAAIMMMLGVAVVVVLTG
jgi:hypothetical protein